MTTTSRPLPPHAGTPPTSAVARVPFGRVVKAELRKALASRSGRWLLTAAGLVLTAVVVVRLLTADPEDLTLRGFVEVSSAPLSLLLPLLSVLAVTTEWSQRTALRTFTLEPSRVRVVLAKLAAVVTVALLAVAAALTAAAVGNVVGALLLDGSGAWTLAAPDVGDLVLTLLLAAVQGFAFGLLLRNTAAAIVLYYLVAPVVSTVLTLVDAVEGAAPWLDLSTAVASVSSGAASGQDWAQLATATTLWVLLPLGLGIARLLRGEITLD